MGTWKMGIISVELLADALREKLKGRNYDSESIEKLAEYIMGFFGFEDRVIDNMLSNEDRDMFYFLEDNGILRSGFEDTTLEKGKPWRIHYWILNKDEILRAATHSKKQKETEFDSAYHLYMNPDLWKRGEDKDEH
jgi:hypothetical protein